MRGIYNIPQPAKTMPTIVYPCIKIEHKGHQPKHNLKTATAASTTAKTE